MSQVQALLPSITSSRSAWLRSIGLILLYGSIVIRAIVELAGNPYRSLALVLLAVYGLLLFVESWFKLSPERQAGEDQTDGRPAWGRTVYLLLQGSIVLALLLIPPHKDFLATLFLPFSLQAVLYFGWKAGLKWIAGTIVAMAGPLLATGDGPAQGLVMGFFYAGLCLLFGRYAHLVQRAELAHLENQRLLAELQAAHQQLLETAAQVEDLAVAQERNRLARELHDSVTQTVFSMNLTAQAARLLLEKDPSRVDEQLTRLQELDQSAMGEIQLLLAELKPRAVLEGGLAAALGRLAAERKQRDGLRVRLEAAAPRDLPEPVALGLYRIAQEALNNAAKHSGAAEVILRLNLEARPAYLEVEDCGAGFELDAASAAAQQKGHIGLVGMVERAREIGWQLAIVSRPGSGTRVRVEGGLE